MYKILIVILLDLRSIFKNRGVTAVIYMLIRMCYRRPDGHCLGLICIYIYFKK
jgi:hypothetical protein